MSLFAQFYELERIVGDDAVYVPFLHFVEDFDVVDGPDVDANAVFLAILYRFF